MEINFLEGARPESLKPQLRGSRVKCVQGGTVIVRAVCTICNEWGG